MERTSHHTSCGIRTVNAAGSLNLDALHPKGNNNIIKIGYPFVWRAQLNFFTLSYSSGFSIYL
jgi:hypothetical protein